MKIQNNERLARISALIAALIMLQTLYFKFTAAEESVYIFTRLGVEPLGRISSGVLELISSVLLVLPKSRFYGAVLGAIIMLGALMTHLFIIGISVGNDGGYLFALCIIVLVSCLLCIIIDSKIKNKRREFNKFKGYR